MPLPDSLDYACEHEEGNLEVSRCSAAVLRASTALRWHVVNLRMIYGLFQLWLQCCSVLSLYHGTLNILDRQ